MIADSTIYFDHSQPHARATSTVSESELDATLQRHLRELLHNDDDESAAHADKRARVDATSNGNNNNNNNNNGSVGARVASRIVCDWSQDGLLAFVPLSEVRRLFGERRSISIAHVNAPTLVGAIETFHEAPINVLQFAPLSTGRLLLSIDCVSHIGVWMCDSALNRWRLVPNMQIRTLDFSFAATWIRWNATLSPFVPACWAAATTVPPLGISLMEQKVRNPLYAPDAAPALFPGTPCALIVSRGKLLTLYERSEDPRWGYAAEHGTLPPDAVAGDVWQHADGTIRIVIVCNGGLSALVYIIESTVRESAKLNLRHEASIQAAHGRRIELARISRLPRRAASVVLVTAPVQAAGPGDDAAAADESRWRLERWQVEQRSVLAGTSELSFPEYVMVAGNALEVGETITDIVVSNSSLIAVALGNADAVQLRFADSLALLPTHENGSAFAAVQTRRVSEFCMAFSPCGTCLAVSTRLGEQPLFGLRILRLAPSLASCMTQRLTPLRVQRNELLRTDPSVPPCMREREQLVRYLVDCYQHAIVLGWSTWDLDATVQCAEARGLLPEEGAASFYDAVAHLLLSECGNNANFVPLLTSTLASLQRQRGADGAIAAIDRVAAQHVRCLSSVIGVVLDNADLAPFENEFYAAATANDPKRFLSAAHEFTKLTSIVAIAPLLNWLIDFVALFVGQAVAFAQLSTKPLPVVPKHMAASDVAIVGAEIAALAGHRVPLLSQLFDFASLRALLKLTFSAGVLGDQWNAALVAKSQPALFANAPDVRALYLIMRDLVAAVDRSVKDLPQQPPHVMTPGVHAATLVNAVAAEVANVARSKPAHVSWLTAFLARRSQAVAASIGLTLADDARDASLASSNMAAAFGLLITAADLLPRRIGPLDSDVGGLGDLPDGMRALLHVDLLTRQSLSSVAMHFECVQCGRGTFSHLPFDLHHAWLNCCPLCHARTFEVDSKV